MQRPNAPRRARSFRKTSIAAIGGLAVAALALSACSGGDGNADPSKSPTVDPNAVLTVGLVLEPKSLDIRTVSGAALEQVLIDNVYQGLVTRTPKGEIEPALASGYEISSDNLTYTFTLREGITFHKGGELTPSDVVTSLEYARDTEGVVEGTNLAEATSIVADGNDIAVTLTKPDANFLWNLTGRAGLIFDEGDTTTLATDTNGTGPFTLGKWIQGDSISLDRFDGYWGEPAKVAEAVLTYIPDFTAGVNAMLDGSLDVLTAVDPNLSSQLDGTDGIALTFGATTDKGTLAFNNARAPLNDPRVREALRIGVDHEAIVEALGAGSTLYGPIPPTDPGYEDLAKLVPFDPEKAKTLLKEAGQEDLELTLTIPSFYGTTVSTVLVSMYNDIGVTLKVNAVEFNTWLEDVYTNKDYDLSFVLHVEARDFGNWANPDYYFNYDNPKVQQLYAEAMASTDQAKVDALLAEAARIVSSDNAADWLYNAETVTAVRPSVTGFPTDSINARINLANVEVTSE